MPKTKKDKSKNDAQEPIIVLTETVDINKIFNIFRDDNIVLNEESCTSLIKFIEAGGTQSISYYPSKNDSSGSGRLYASSGVQWLDKKLRGYLLQDNYIDIDIKNCLPTTINILLLSKNYSNYNFNNYVNNRDKLLDQFNLTKQDIISCISNDNYIFSKSQAHSFLRELWLEARTLVPDSEDQGSAISTLCFTYERDFMYNLITKLISAKIEVFAWIFDGIIVHKKYTKQLQQILDRSNSCHQYQLIIKPWESITITPDTIKIYGVEQKLYNRFDYHDPTTYKDIFANTGEVYSSIYSAFFKNYKILLKTVRLINCNNEHLVKCSKKSYKILSKLAINYIVKNGNIRTRVPLRDLLSMCPQIFSTETITPFPSANDHHFSVFPDFIAKRVNYTIEDLKPILDHIEHAWASDTPNLADYWLDWFASMVQNVPFKTETLMILQGDQGTGKSIIFEWLKKYMFGRLCFTVTGSDKLTGKFNGHLSGKLLVCLEELKSTDDKITRHDLDRIKHIITTPTLDIERKGIDTIEEDNGLNVVAFTNAVGNPLPLVDGIERRLVQTTISSVFQDDSAYFKKLALNLNQDMADKFYSFLLDRIVNYTRLRFEKPKSTEKFRGQWNQLPDITKSIYCLLNDNPEYDEWLTANDLIDALPRGIGRPITGGFSKNNQNIHNGRILKKYNIEFKRNKEKNNIYHISKATYKINKDLMAICSEIMDDINGSGYVQY